MQEVYFVEILEAALGVTDKKNFLPLQAGDVLATYADIEAFHHDVGFTPRTSIEVGIPQFVQWYQSYLQLQFDFITLAAASSHPISAFS